VTVFERSARPGGLLRYGIPDFKLEKAVLDRRLSQMTAEGVRFQNGVAVGEDISTRYLRQSFDAVLLTMGAGEPRDLTVPGRELKGVHYAMDYLTLSNQRVGGEVPDDAVISARQDRARHRRGRGQLRRNGQPQGARKVISAIMPKPRCGRRAQPPWPMAEHLRTSSSRGRAAGGTGPSTPGVSGVDGHQRGTLCRVE
jgi:glutamate synthase (NADPH/NADH) small chain